MSALTDRIAEVLRKHTWGIYRDGAGIAHSGCMCKVGVDVDYAAHVAERVAAELQLTEEREDRYGPRGAVPFRRWVSAWSEVTP